MLLEVIGVGIPRGDSMIETEFTQRKNLWNISDHVSMLGRYGSQLKRARLSRSRDSHWKAVLSLTNDHGGAHITGSKD
jgi:hypothetical protein